MKCMHCLVEFHSKKEESYINKDADGYWVIQAYACPACNRLNLFLANGSGYNNGGLISTSITSRMAVHPLGTSRPPVLKKFQLTLRMIIRRRV